MAHPYLQQLLDCARNARGDDAADRDVVIAGSAVTLHFASAELEAKLFPALSHLAEDDAGACVDTNVDRNVDRNTDTDVYTDANKLHIHIWDSRGSGIELPDPESGSARTLMEQGERWGVNLRAGDPQAPRLYYMPPPNEYVCALDPQANHAVYWFPDASRIPYYERGSPLRTLFDWWLESRGLLLTHAAAVGNTTGNAAGGALIVGKGGRGKSTSAIMSMIVGGLSYVSDDYLVLEPAPDPTAHSIYSTGKLNADHLQERLPQLLPMLDNPDHFTEEKGLFFFREHYPERIVPRLPLRIALLPDVYEGTEAHAVPTDPQRLLLGLAASTIYQSTGNGALALKLLRETLLALPCYSLRVGSDFSSIGPCISELLRKHASD